MENLPGNNGNGQAYGYTLYETTIIRGGSLKSGRNIQDRALVSADKQSRCAVVYEYASALFHFNQDSPPPQVFVNQSFIGIFHHRNVELAVSDGKVWFMFHIFIFIFVLLTLSWCIKKQYLIIVRSCNYIYPILYLLMSFIKHKLQFKSLGSVRFFFERKWML